MSDTGYKDVLKNMPGDEQHEIVIWRWFGKYHKKIREALEKSQMRYELDEEGAPMPLSVEMAWKRPLIIRAAAEGLSARACARVFGVSHEACSQFINKGR